MSGFQTLGEEMRSGVDYRMKRGRVLVCKVGRDRESHSGTPHERMMRKLKDDASAHCEENG
jgi:hypothetical protein